MKRIITSVILVLLASQAFGQEPWLPEAEQRLNADLWAQTGVPMPAGMKFYKLRKVSQRLVIVNTTMSNGIYASEYVHETTNLKRQHEVLPNPFDKDLWATPGGLTWAPKEEWRNAFAAYFPGTIDVTRDWISVKTELGKQNNTIIRWKFPEGTIFADLLVRRDAGKEFPFELRVRQKKDGEWESTAYRPWGDDDELPPGTAVKNAAFKINDAVTETRDAATFRLPEGTMPTKQFKPATRQFHGAFYPKDYWGNLASCVSCHNRAGESGSYASVNAPGNDGNISWHPYSLRTLNTDRPPEFDQRWPIRVNLSYDRRGGP
jgi:hypothetical protein